MYLIAGLGNPGSRYADTRHNVGFMAVDALAKLKGFSLLRAEHFGLTGTYTELGQKVKVVKPQTFMNDSGRCVAALAHFYKIPVAHIIVMYDDTDLPAGKLRVRKKGGPGTHNGMRSVVKHLGETDFPRVRIGIGAKPAGWDLAHYVLAQLKNDPDADAIRGCAKRAAEAAALIVTDGADNAMNRMN